MTRSSPLLSTSLTLDRPALDPDALQARFEANLAAFERCQPRLHARLSHLGRPASALVPAAGGGVDLAQGEARLYGGDATAFALHQLAGWLQRPERLFVSLANARTMYGIAGEFARWTVDAAAQAGVPLDRGRTDHVSHFTVVFGAGLAMHLKPLAERTGCREMIVVEPNIEHIYQSLFVADWVDLLEGEEAPVLRFVTDGDQDAIAGTIRDIVRGSAVPMLDGVYLFLHHPTGLLATAHEQFRRDLSLHLYGLGFYEDELVMMSNTVANLVRRPGRVIATPLPVRDTPVFLCGSGPSIDGCIDLIRDLRERAIVVSLGSSLRTLRAAGIRPDFHVELENDEANADNVAGVVEEFGVEGITLIAATPVRPRLAAAFDDVIWYFRDQVSPSMVLAGGADPLGACGPAVANAAQMALLYLGFRQIYLFGVDMGSRSPDTYHSANTYIGLGVRKEWGTGKRQDVPANFGGTAFAEGLLNWSRFTFANVARLHPDMRCFNCSDGARIAHTIPLLPRRIRLAERPLEREAVLARIREALPLIGAGHCRDHWRRPMLEADARMRFDEIDALLAQAAAGDGADLDWMRALYARTLYVSGPGAPTRVFLFGTTVMVLAALWGLDGRMPDDAGRRALRVAAAARLREVYRRMDDRYSRLLDDVDAFLDGRLDGLEANNREAA